LPSFRRKPESIVLRAGIRMDPGLRRDDDQERDRLAGVAMDLAT
jgi:hypothetical protein